VNRHNLQGANWHFDKILFAVASIYFAIVVGWLLSKDKLRLLFIGEQPSSSPVEPAKATPSIDPQFTAYLNSSLEAIARRSKAAQESLPAPPTVAIPPAVVSAPPPPQNPPTIIEKVYVPVYPQPQGSSPAAPPTASQPSSLSPQTTASANSNAASKVKKASLTLVGLLESGDRSSALFKMNETTRRIELGEAIGTSGWTLVSVQNQQAIVYADGKTRSLEVGQGF